MYWTERRKAARSCVSILLRSVPRYRTLPLLGSMSPAAMRAVVVFPHPDSPTRHSTRPVRTCRSTPATAGTAPRPVLKVCCAASRPGTGGDPCRPVSVTGTAAVSVPCTARSGMGLFLGKERGVGGAQTGRGVAEIVRSGTQGLQGGAGGGAGIDHPGAAWGEGTPGRQLGQVGRATW